jgi:fibronectin-binding autotransporter adhesin
MKFFLSHQARRRSLAALLSTCLFVDSAGQAFAVDKLATGTELTDSASWTGGTVPNATGTNSPLVTGTGAAVWTATSSTGTHTVGSAVNWDVLSFANTTALTINGQPITLAGVTTSGSYDVIRGDATGARTINNDLNITGVHSATAIAVGNTSSRLQILGGNNGLLTLNNVTANGATLVANDVNLFLRGSGSGNVINGTLTVDGQLGKGDSGTWTLNGSNSVGWTFTNNGTLLAGNNAAFGAGTIYFGNGGGAMTLASASTTARSFANNLDIQTTNIVSFGQTSGGTGALTFAGNLNLGTTVRLITINAATNFNGIISGIGGGYNKDGTAKLTLGGLNTYTGVTTIRGSGTNGVSTTSLVEVSFIGNGNVAGNLGQASNIATNIIFGLNGTSSGQLNYVGTGESTDRLFSLSGHAIIVSSGTGALKFTNTGAIAHLGSTANHTLTLAGTNTADNTLASVIGDGTGVGVISVTKTNAGMWILTGTNTYSGITRFDGGILAAGNSSAFGTSQLRFGGGTIASSDPMARTFTTGKSLDFAAGSTFGTATTGNLLFTDAANLGGGKKRRR